MRWLVVGVGIGSIILSNRAPAQEVMTGEQLSAVAESVRGFVPKDQFDTPPPTPSVAGKRFAYVVTPLERGPENAICSGFASWGFWPSDEHYEVSDDAGSVSADRLQGSAGRLFPQAMTQAMKNDELSFHSFTCQKTKGPDYTAQNGFGAQITIEKATDRVFAVANFEPEIDPHWQSYWTAKVGGDAARQLAQNVRVRISGTLQDWWPGASVLCGTNVLTPTARFPYDRTLDICMFRGHADLLEMFNVATGEVLYSAKRR